MDGQTQTPATIKRKLAYRRLWQAKLLNRRIKKGAIPIEISQFKKIKGTIGLHGYRRIRKEDRDNVRAYRKDSYGITFMFINLEESSIEGKTETWGGLMGVCSDFNLRSYRSV
jgi:hypothetical protein